MATTSLSSPGTPIWLGQRLCVAQALFSAISPSFRLSRLIALLHGQVFGLIYQSCAILSLRD